MEQILRIIPPRLRPEVGRLREEAWEQLEELRLHPGQPVLGRFSAGERAVGESPLEEEELGQVVELACRGSVHCFLPQLRRGYLTLAGGHRLGICGSVSLREGEVRAIEPISSLNLRLARSRPGIARPLIPRLLEGGRPVSTLILAPPGMGKTTLLRDLIRSLSAGDGCHPRRVSLADERGEVAALYRGRAQLDVGPGTDVMEGCPKAMALMLLLRGMGPEVLAADEITAPEDVQALLTAAGCGVSLLATAHGESREDLSRRPLYRRLLEEGIFRRLVCIGIEDGRRRYRVEVLE